MIYEVSALGGDRYWVQAASVDEVHEAIAGTGAACWGEVHGIVKIGQIDYALPARLEQLRHKLMGVPHVLNAIELRGN